MVPAAVPNGSFLIGQEVAIVSIRTGVLEDVLPVSAVSPQGNIVVTGWKGFFSPDGLEVRQPVRKATAVRQHSCEVISLHGRILGDLLDLPTGRQPVRKLRPRWFIRVATPEDRAVLDARDDDLRLMRLITQRLKRAARSANLLPREALLEISRLVGQATGPGQGNRAADAAVQDVTPGFLHGQGEASMARGEPTSSTAP
ncbi:hypothetical protein [Roseomonas indoligenes]|uniref:Uncharacterized protein n=1 Tax=Roseomonas indoligenes TaxID=2820811 RepID=A0A940N1I4_9PROT|nr:hypothetical protein [Pararoseomonas indoligenes]MBP0495015.1 hypothetical protein [Pararoseomonas indoligenes]